MFVVVGAGIAGLAAALALAPHGDVVVAERRTHAAANAGAGIQLSPNACHALMALQAFDRVAAVASRPEGLAIRRAGRADPLVRVPYGSPLEARFGAPSLTSARSDLHGALWQAAEDHPRITLRFNAAVRTVIRADTETFVLRDLGINARFVVAADGVGSDLRAHLVGDRERRSGMVAWRGRGGKRDPIGDTQLIMASGRHLVRYALASGGDNVVLVAHERSRGPQAAHPLAIEHDDVEGWMPWPIRVRPRHVFEAGGVALVGDAAHAMCPFLAQGAAMALEDAAVLGHAVARHGPSDHALESYRAARRPRTQRIARQSDQQGFLYHLAAPLCFARDFAMTRLGAGAVADRVSWIYGWRPPA